MSTETESKLSQTKPSVPVVGAEVDVPITNAFFLHVQ